MVDKKLNVKEPKDQVLPEGLIPHGISVRNSKELLVSCSKGTLAVLSFDQNSGDKAKIRTSRLFGEEVTIYHVMQT